MVPNGETVKLLKVKLQETNSGKEEFTFQAMVIHLLLRLLEMGTSKHTNGMEQIGMKKMRYPLFQVIMMLLVNYT